MANITLFNSLLFLLLFTFILSPILLAQGSKAKFLLPCRQKTSLSQEETQFQNSRNSRRLMIGSTAPTCTYNECRGCKYKCRAEQVPVEGNDPINSAYHYKCVCHR